ncbi:MAG: RnfABCDGE type electron transport complex subunit G [Cyclobacteriaceae bacterium]
MSEPATISNQGTNNLKMLQAMVGIGVICALLIVLTYEGTLPRVERLKEEALQKAIFQVIPGAERTETYILEKGQLKRSDANAELIPRIYAGFDASDQFVGWAIEAAGQGYADVIKVLYGYDPIRERVIGFQVLESKETPGLGDKIEKDENFLYNFKNMDAGLTADKSKKINAIVTVKSGNKQSEWEVDGITGATISSRAIAAILDSSTEEWGPVLTGQLDVFSKQENDE